MIKRKIGDKEYSYDKKQENLIISSMIKDAMDIFCKENKIKKSSLVEKFYKAILLNYRDGSLENTKGFVTLNILNNIQRKGNKYFLKPV